MKEPKTPPVPEPSGKDALKKLSDLTRRIVAIPKEEIEMSKKRPKPRPA